MNQNLRIIFFGSSIYTIPIIQVLKSAKSRFNLKLVVTTDRNPTDAIPSYCLKNKIKFIPINKFNNEVISAIRQSDAEIGILANFGIIIPANILNIFPFGIVNIHPSLLPKYRGPTPIQTAILNGDKKTGATIIKMDEQVDHGPILFQKEEKISVYDTFETLARKLFDLGAENLSETIIKFVNNKIIPIPQNDLLASFTQLLKKSDGQIQLENPPPSDKLEKMIRAYFPWPGVFFKANLSDKERIVKLLPDKQIQVEGKKPMSYKDFVNGYTEAVEILSKLKLIIN